MAPLLIDDVAQTEALTVIVCITAVVILKIMLLGKMVQQSRYKDCSRQTIDSRPGRPYVLVFFFSKQL